MALRAAHGLSEHCRQRDDGSEKLGLVNGSIPGVRTYLRRDVPLSHQTEAIPLYNHDLTVPNDDQRLAIGVLITVEFSPWRKLGWKSRARLIKRVR